MTFRSRHSKFYIQKRTELRGSEPSTCESDDSYEDPSLRFAGGATVSKIEALGRPSVCESDDSYEDLSFRRKKPTTVTKIENGSDDSFEDLTLEDAWTAVPRSEVRGLFILEQQIAAKAPPAAEGLGRSSGPRDKLFGLALSKAYGRSLPLGRVSCGLRAAYATHPKFRV